jgi:hypothetical protein
MVSPSRVAREGDTIDAAVKKKLQAAQRNETHGASNSGRLEPSSRECRPDDISFESSPKLDGNSFRLGVWSGHSRHEVSLLRLYQSCFIGGLILALALMVSAGCSDNTSLIQVQFSPETSEMTKG